MSFQIFKLVSEKAEEPEIKLPTSAGSSKKQKSSRKVSISVLLTVSVDTKASDCVDHNKLWKILQEMGTPDHLTCLLRNLYESQEATVKTRHGSTVGSKLGKEFIKAVYCHPAYLTYAEYIMQNAELDEAQAGIKIAGRNINLRYADDTTLMAESEEELKSLLIKVKEESKKAGLKLNIQKTEIMAFGPITSWKIDGETVETVTDYFSGLQNHCRW